MSLSVSRSFPAPVSSPPPDRPAPVPSRAHGIPSLDGIRALSIAMVVAWHLSSSGSAPWLVQLWRIDSGNLGVRIFFVISGYLITSLLLAEHARTGTVNLRRFYFRRACRIMPAFYFFLAVMAVAGAFGVVSVSLLAISLLTLTKVQEREERFLPLAFGT